MRLTTPDAMPGLISTLPVGAVLALALIAAGVIGHPATLQGSGARLLWMDVALLMAYGVAAVWVAGKSGSRLSAAVRVGTTTGIGLGAVLAANHLAEIYVRDRNFALVICPVFLALALFAGTGSAARERTGSVSLGVVAGVWCAMVGVVILLCAGFIFNFAFQSRAEVWLREAFAASGMTDAGGFVVRNSLEAAFEGLVRMPMIAMFLAFFGGLANAWMKRGSRTAALAGAGLALVGFLVGAACLWHANSLPRSARPPLIMAGVLLASVALAAAHPGWSALRGGVRLRARDAR